MVRALALVAHPDDETIWMGGTIMRNKMWDWTIFSLCRKSDLDRMSKFRKVCDLYNATSIIGDLEDENLEPLSEAEIIDTIKDSINGQTYDYIFTHGKNGEYGHIRHKEVYRAVKSMIKRNQMKYVKVFYFSYIESKNHVPDRPDLMIPVPKPNPQYFITLDKKELESKKKIITELYGFAKDSFEALSCNKNEAFIIDRTRLDGK